ncbi:MAG: hypothetical protein WC438_03555 [Candidatus Pacearchaeota archaeon]
MEKRINKKVFILPVLILTLLTINLIMISSADDTTAPATNNPLYDSNTYDSTNTKVWSWINTNILEKYIVPDQKTGSDQPANMWLVVSVIGFIVFSLIILELANLLPLSTFTNLVIGIGALIILVLSGGTRKIVGGLMYFIAVMVGAGGMIGMIMIGVIFVVLAVAIFTGSAPLHRWIDKIRFNKELSKKTSKAYKAAADVSALNTEAQNLRYRS